MASSPVANAAPSLSEDRGKPNAMGLVKTEIPKTPKPYPANFPALTAEGLEESQIQQPTLNSGAESPAVPPEAHPLQNENLRTDAADLRLETFEVSVSDSPTSPALSTDATGSEIELGFPGSAQGEGFLGVDPAALSLGEGAAADRFSGAVAQADLITQTAGSTDDIPWRFSFEPFVYLPFSANGNVTVRSITAPINAGIGDIFSSIVNDLNFAAFGRVEAWKGTWGMFFSGAYVNMGTGRSANIPLPPVLQQAGLPPQVSIAAAAGASFVQLDLGGAYRFGDGNLPVALRTADTEFDLGPFIFDALAGVRLYSFNNKLVLTGDLGNRFEFGQSQTVVEPMIGGRARWNLSPNLAALVGTSMSGFSLGNLTFSVAGYAGIDWLFSGNTSLLASYGFTYIDYSSNNSGLDLFTHGPNIGVKFRF
ncbi:hypothetical protein RRF56_00940 (plasmid) [Nodosilinea sp. E11]|nr:hypothetical protein RRF56_00940 [Nodosilinea sp. E11]